MQIPLEFESKKYKMSGRRKHTGDDPQINLCRIVDRKSHTKSRGEYQFFAVALAGRSTLYAAIMMDCE